MDKLNEPAETPVTDLDLKEAKCEGYRTVMRKHLGRQKLLAMFNDTFSEFVLLFVLQVKGSFIRESCCAYEKLFN